MAHFQYFRDNEWHDFPEHTVWGWHDGQYTWRKTRDYVDAGQAVEEWAEMHDSYGDYTIVGGSAEYLPVREVDSNDVTLFRVTGESVPQYSADAFDPDNLERDAGPWEAKNVRADLEAALKSIAEETDHAAV